MSPDQETYLPYGRQTVNAADIAAVVEVLHSPYLTQGPVVPAFERRVAAQVGAQFGVAVNSATSALHLACLALGLGPNDRIWTSPITFVASANCGRYCGACIDFVDIDPNTGLMSTEALQHKLEHAEQLGTLPRVVVPVHLTGSSCDMASIGSLAKRYGFAVVEDASHAIGGRYRGEPVGNCAYSDITVFSFHPVKIITTGEGGIATTNNPELARKMAMLRSHGIEREPDRFVATAAGPWAYEQQQLGFNYRMTEIQAALGLSQIQRLNEIVSERNKQLELYRSLLDSLPANLLEIPEDVTSSVHLSVIRLTDISPKQHRQVFEGLRQAGIGVQLHYSPVHLQPYYQNLGFSESQFPHSEAYATCAMTLPLFPGLSKDDQQRVVKNIEEQLAVVFTGD